jgi:hypothetical protein
MTSGWTDASGWQITLPTAQDLAAEIGAYRKGRRFKRDAMKFIDERNKFLGEYRTTTGAIKPLPIGADTWESFQSHLDHTRKAIANAYGIDWSGLAQRERAKSNLLERLNSMTEQRKESPKPPEPKVTPIIDRLTVVARLLAMHNVPTQDVSIVLLEADWFALRDEIDLFYNWRPEEGASSLRYCGIEFLRGGGEYSVWLNKPIPPNHDAIACEIIRCLSGGRVSELPKSTGGNGVSTSPDTGDEISVAASPAISDNRNRNGVRHIPDQLDVVSAKAALAAYARDKKLPGSVSLAQLRELDNRLATKKAVAKACGAGGAPLTDIWYDEAAAITPEMLDALTSAGFAPRKVDGHRDGLSSESLGRAIDQLNVAEHSRAHRDFIGAAAQGFAEMLDAGDATAHRKR